MSNASQWGYYGKLTQIAVEAFQGKYHVAKLGDTGYGVFGPATQAMAASLK